MPKYLWRIITLLLVASFSYGQKKKKHAIVVRKKNRTHFHKSMLENDELFYTANKDGQVSLELPNKSSVKEERQEKLSEKKTSTYNSSVSTSQLDVATDIKLDKNKNDDKSSVERTHSSEGKKLTSKVKKKNTHAVGTLSVPAVAPPIFSNPHSESTAVTKTAQSSLIIGKSIAAPDSSNITVFNAPSVALNHFTGIASFYSAHLDGTLTSTGETFRHSKLTAASNSIQLNSIVRVTNIKNNRSVIVRINDRMHPRMAKKGRIVDLSISAATELHMIDQGLAKVQVEVLKEPSKRKRSKT